MKKAIIFVGVSALLFGYYSCKTKSSTASTPGKTAVLQDSYVSAGIKDVEDPSAKNGIDLSLLHSSVRPQDDFFGYVNNNWIQQNPIPGNKGSWGMFNVLREQSLNDIKEILDHSISLNSAPGSNMQLLGDFYKTGMDTNRIDQLGVSPLKPWFDKVNKVNDKKSLSILLADLDLHGVNVPFGIGVNQDYKDASKQVMWLSNDGLGLPDKEYYTSAEKQIEAVREAYKKYISDLFIASGEDEATAKKHAETVFNLEAKMAENTLSKVEMRDPEKLYHPMKTSEVAKTLSIIDFETYFAQYKVPFLQDLVVVHPPFIKAFNELYSTANLSDWKIYFKARLLDASAGLLSKPFQNAAFEYKEKTLQGKRTQEERWKKVSNAAEYYMRDIIGQEYVKKRFSPVAKERALELVSNLRYALGERIKNLAWMSQETKKKAQLKLDKIDVKIGYPNQWRTYQGLQVNASNTFFDNVMNCKLYESFRNLNKLGKPVDRTEWFMGPQTVNAYYNPSKNEIVFPAAILQPPFFSETADDALNYGGIGMVIGHEITHGFDDEGSQFDADGNLASWWTAEDRSKFETLTKKLANQYSEYVAVDDMKVNGELTLGENIADLGGINITYDALNYSLRNKRVMMIDGLTPQQRFFINFAQIWRTHDRPQVLIQKIKTDPHSPAKFRVNGVLPNFDAFYHVYGLNAQDKLWLEEKDRIKIW